MTPNSRPTGIAAGTDGALWFTESASPGRIGRITTGGDVTEYTEGLTADRAPWMITPGPDGNMWFTENANPGALARISLPPRLLGTRVGQVEHGLGASSRREVRPNAQATDFSFVYGPGNSFKTTSDGVLGRRRLGPRRGDRVKLDGLKPGKTFRFRVVATNDSGTDYGDTGEFTTHALEPEHGEVVVAEPNGPRALQAPGRPLAAARRHGRRAAGGHVDRHTPRQDRAHHRRPERQEADRHLRRRRHAGAPAQARARAAWTSTCAAATSPAARAPARARAGPAPARTPRTVRRVPCAGCGATTAAAASAPSARHSQATVRGTRWLTEDTCAGTLTFVTRGAVVVRDFARRRNIARARRPPLPRAARRAAPRASGLTMEHACRPSPDDRPPPPRRAGGRRARRLRDRSRRPRVRCARPARARGAQDALRRARRGAARRTSSSSAIDAKTFDVLRQQWPFPRSLHGQVDPPPARRRRARDRLRRPVHRAHDAARGPRALRRASATPAAPCSPPARATGTATRDVLGGDANLRRDQRRAPPRPTCATTRAGAIARFPREVGGLDTHRRVAAPSALGAAARPPATASATAAPGSTTAARPARSAPSRSPTSCDGRFADPSCSAAASSWSARSAPTLRDVHSTPVGGDAARWPAPRSRRTRSGPRSTARRSAPRRRAVDLLVLVALLAMLPPLVGCACRLRRRGRAHRRRRRLFLVAAQLAFDAGLIVDVVAPLLALILGGVRHDRLEPARRAPRALPRRAATTSCSSSACASAPRTLADPEARSRSASAWPSSGATPRPACTSSASAAAASGSAREVGHERRRGRAAAPRQRAPRRGQGRHPRRDPLEAGQLDAGRVGEDEDPHDDRGEHPVRVDVARSSRWPSRSP